MAVSHPEIGNAIVRWWMLPRFHFRDRLPVRTRDGTKHRGHRTGVSADDGWELVFPAGDWLEFAHPRSGLFPEHGTDWNYLHRAVVDDLRELPPALLDRGAGPGAGSGADAIDEAATVRKWMAPLDFGAPTWRERRVTALKTRIGRIQAHPVADRRVIWYREGEPLAAMTVRELCRLRLAGADLDPEAVRPAEAAPVPTGRETPPASEAPQPPAAEVHVVRWRVGSRGWRKTFLVPTPDTVPDFVDRPRGAPLVLVDRGARGGTLRAFGTADLDGKRVSINGVTVTLRRHSGNRYEARLTPAQVAAMRA